jgi:hypothetical protein
MNKKEILTVNGEHNKPEIIFFSLCHTTARFPDGWRPAIQMWKDRADHPELVEHVLCVDYDPPATDGLYKTKPIFHNTKTTLNYGRHCCVDGWNEAAICSTGKFLINVADDLFPPEHWDTLLLEELNTAACVKGTNEFWEDLELALDIETGAPNWTAAGSGLMTFCFITRKYYERYGYLLYPEYISVYSDNDFTDQARRDGVVINARHLKFEHRHPIYDSTVKTDSVYEGQSSAEAWEVGRKVYIKRSQSRGYTVKKKIMICLPGESYSAAWTSMWTQLLHSLMPFFDVIPLFCYSTNVYVTRAALANAIMESKPSPDYVLWIDDDNLLTFDQFMILLKDLEDNPQADSVSAWTWIMGDVFASPSKVSVGVFDGKGDCKALDPRVMREGIEDLIKIDWTGFPVVLMRYEAIVKTGGHKAFQPYPAPGHAYGFYGEDASFCKRAQDVGVRLYVDRRVKVPHLKLQGVEPIMAESSKEMSAHV